MELKQWATKHSECLGCGTVAIPHRARGLCSQCYSKTILRNGWPIWLEQCIRCSVDWDQAAYRSSGLCYSCVTQCKKADELEEWRTMFILVRAQCREDGMKPLNALALRIGRTIGSTEAAERMGVDREAFRSWAMGKRAVPKSQRAALMELGRDCAKWSYEL